MEFTFRAQVLYEASRQDNQEIILWLECWCREVVVVRERRHRAATSILPWIPLAFRSVFCFTHTASVVAGSTIDGKRPEFAPFVWALPAKTNPFWQTKFMHLAVQYCPESSLELEWMPLWAAQCGDLFVLKQLRFVKHPQLFTQQTFEAIMRYTKAGNSLQWFQAHSPTLMGDLSIVEWGVKYRQFVYLTYVFLDLQPVRSEECFRQRGVEYALHVACAMGHLDVVTWICGNCEIFLKGGATCKARMTHDLEECTACCCALWAD
ncbi:unnamed protein product [Peronospora destructor]|uniref:Ankyrin repeat-containing domain n=1 Tax=Peronospora destructor TaxID=86335 RepID=A0AAV0U1Y8_9STRA|nr:unnamed protein product [Peronospora destructor]